MFFVVMGISYWKKIVSHKQIVSLSMIGFCVPRGIVKNTFYSAHFFLLHMCLFVACFLCICGV
jgi:hypothetical protein